VGFRCLLGSDEQSPLKLGLDDKGSPCEPPSRTKFVDLEVNFLFHQGNLGLRRAQRRIIIYCYHAQN
jgi:hypothetical protein